MCWGAWRAQGDPSLQEAWGLRRGSVWWVGASHQGRRDGEPRRSRVPAPWSWGDHGPSPVFASDPGLMLGLLCSRSQVLPSCSVHTEGSLRASPHPVMVTDAGATQGTSWGSEEAAQFSRASSRLPVAHAHASSLLCRAQGQASTLRSRCLPGSRSNGVRLRPGAPLTYWSGGLAAAWTPGAAGPGEGQHPWGTGATDLLPNFFSLKS